MWAWVRYDPPSGLSAVSASRKDEPRTVGKRPSPRSSYTSPAPRRSRERDTVAAARQRRSEYEDDTDVKAKLKRSTQRLEDMDAILDEALFNGWTKAQLVHLLEDTDTDLLTEADTDSDDETDTHPSDADREDIVSALVNNLDILLEYAEDE